MNVDGHLLFYEWFNKEDSSWVSCEILKSMGPLSLVKDLNTPLYVPHLINRELISVLGTHDKQNEYEKETEEKWLRIRRKLKKTEKILHQVATDGNCLFRSLSELLFGCESFYEMVRDEVVGVMRSYEGLLSAW